MLIYFFNHFYFKLYYLSNLNTCNLYFFYFLLPQIIMICFFGFFFLMEDLKIFFVFNEYYLYLNFYLILLSIADCSFYYNHMRHFACFTYLYLVIWVYFSYFYCYNHKISWFFGENHRWIIFLRNLIFSFL